MFIKIPMKGMPEQLPADMKVREYALRLIKDTYQKYGFSLIETPAIEHIENLTNKQGGENEQLIFKILKRGNKFIEAKDTNEICDSGLRYDLTVPLARFYSNNVDKLTLPFKSLQIGSAWRADNPQKGRFRQFTQCDIDIIGDETNLSEIELISATTDMLNKLGLGTVKIRINDRRILKAMALSCNFPEEQLDTIYIILDKYDKIGLEGIEKNLIELGLNVNDVKKYCKYFEGAENLSSCKSYLSNIKDFLSEAIVDNLENIMLCTSEIIKNKGEIFFDPTLVRGMSYYTGPIFEIELKGYNLSIAGGGRYDEMIGKYTGNNVCACGFSIGFERIVSIIKDSGTVFHKKDNLVYLIAKGVDYSKIKNVLIKANELRAEGKNVMVSPRNKNAKFQKEKLAELGYENFIDVFEDTEII